MAISEVCKFEVKKEIDSCVEGGMSRNAAARWLADVFSDALGREIKSETIRKKDQRARNELGTNVPKKSKDRANQASTKNCFKSGCGGKRNNSGRPKKESAFDKCIEEKIRDTKKLNIELIKVKGFLVDIQSAQLRNALIAEIKRCKDTFEKILSEYKENGF